MDRLLTLNGKSYKAAEFDLNLICDFEERGISLEDIGKKMFSVVRQYVAASMGVEPYVAGKEITTFIENGGEFEYIANVMDSAINDSGFFRTPPKSKTSASQKGTRKKKSEDEEVTS